MSKFPETPVDPSSCCKIPNCMKMLCGAINAYYERMTGAQVIETETGDEKVKFAGQSAAGLKIFIAGLQAQCGTAETQPFVDAMTPSYGSYSPSICKDAPRSGCCDGC